MQFILPLDPKNKYHTEEFIKSSCNKKAYERVNSWPNIWGVKPFEKSLLLNGPKSSGKTHLSKLWQHLSNAFLIDLENDSINYDKVLMNNEAFIIEDIVNKKLEETALHYFNLIHEQNKFLLITLDTEVQIQLKDLGSRVNSLEKIEILSPDDELIRMLLFKNFSINSISIKNNVLDYLLPLLPRQFDKIISVASIINHYALLHQRPITVPLVREMIQNNLLF